MNFIHEFKVINLTKRLNVGSLENVIVNCKWQIMTYREDYPNIKEVCEATVPFTINLQDLENNFIPFEDLTEQDVISWIQSSAKSAVISMKTRNKKNITEKIEYVDEVIDNPWETTDQ